MSSNVLNNFALELKGKFMLVLLTDYESMNNVQIS